MFSVTATAGATQNTIAGGEYFIGTPGQPGNGKAFTNGTTGIHSTTLTVTIPQADFDALTDQTSYTVYVEARDAAGNWSSPMTTAQFFKDTLLPLPTVTSTPSLTNQSPIVFNVNFNLPVAGLDTTGFTVTNGAISLLTGSDASYTVQVTPTTPPAAGETVSLQVNALAAVNASDATKANSASNVASVTYDTIGPSATISSLAPTPTSTPPLFSATLADANNTVNAVEYAINTEAANGHNFPISITSAQSVTLTNVAISAAAFNSVTDGTCTLYIHGQDAAGNWGPWSTGTIFERDTVAPTIVLTGTPATGSSTNSAPSVGAAISAIGTTNTVAAAEYFIDTTGPNSSGTPLAGVVGGPSATLTAAISPATFNSLADQATHTIYVHALDVAGNWGTTYATYTFTKDMNIPTAAVTAPTSAANTSPLSFTVNFSAAVTGLTTAGFTVSGGTITPASLTGSGANYTLSVTPTAPGAVTVQVNPNAAYNTAYTADYNTASNVAVFNYVTQQPFLNSITVASSSYPLGVLHYATVTSGGSGYTSAPSVSFSGGGGTGAAGTATINASGQVTGVTITAGGTGYVTAPTIVFSGGNGSGAAGTGVPTILASGGSISTFTLNFNENVTITGTPVLHFAGGATMAYSSGTGTSALNFATFTTTTSPFAANPLDFASGTYLTGGTIVDSGSHAWAPVTAGPGDRLYEQNVQIDGVRPIVTLAPLTNTSPFTFQITANEPLSSIAAGNYINGYYSGSVSNVQRSGPNSFTFQIAEATGTNYASISLVSGNAVYDDALPNNVNWGSNTAEAVATTPADALPTVTVNPPQSGSFSMPLALSGTYNTNGGSAISQIQVDITTTASAYPVNAYTATFANNNWRYTIPANTLTPGTYTAWAMITNADGDIVPSALSTTFNVVDNAPPVTTATPYIHTSGALISPPRQAAPASRAST